MSMLVTTVISDGIVMATDSANSVSRVMDIKNLLSGNLAGAFKNKLSGDILNDPNNIVGHNITSKTMIKLHVMLGNRVAIASGHEWITRNTGQSINPYIHNFCQKNSFTSPKQAAEELLKLIRGIDPTINATFHVAGYNSDGKIPYPEVWVVHVSAGELLLVAAENQGGIMFSGANNYFSQYKPLVDNNLIYYTLQDAIDLSIFAIEMSIKLDRFIKLEEHISPPIDVLVVRNGIVEWVQHKKLEVRNDIF